MESSRRDFLKKSAAAGVVVWSAPAVLSLPAGRTWAQQYGACTCSASAYGLRVIIPALNIDRTFGIGGCEATVAEGAPGVAIVSASAVCSAADSDDADGVCAADASVAGLNVVVGDPVTPDLTVSASVLTSRARVSCEPCGTAGSATIAGLVVNNVSADTSSCNSDPGGLGFVIVNEQTCGGDGTISVNALHIRAPQGVAEVIVSHTEAGPSQCPCHTCFLGL